MTRDDYNMALEGLRSNPERHYNIGGQQPASVEELDALAARFGLSTVAEISEVPEVEQVVQELSKNDPPETVAVPVVPGSNVATVATPVKQPQESAKNDPPERIEIPENLGTLKFAELKVLAKALGIAPVPTVQADLLAAIEAKRPGGQ